MWNVAFGGSTISRTQVQLFYNRFKEGQEDVNDDAHPGRPSTLATNKNIEAGKKMILDNHRLAIWEVADYVGKSFGLCQAIFMDVLGMKCVAAQIVPILANFEQKQRTHGYHSGDVGVNKRQYRFAKKKVITGD